MEPWTTGQAGRMNRAIKDASVNNARERLATYQYICKYGHGSLIASPPTLPATMRNHAPNRTFHSRA
ncbi:MAG: hypothetical protein ACREDH_13430 [Methylocella sp.]